MRLGLGQMLVEYGNPESNISRACSAVREGGQRGCDVVLLPECLDLGWANPAGRELAELIPGPRSQSLCKAAEQAGVYVAAGLTEHATDRVYNSAVLISPEGEILLHHSKINELDFAREIYATGTSLQTADTGIGRIGLAICADLFPETNAIGKALALMGAELILCPCSWAVPVDYDYKRVPYGGLWLESYSDIARTYHVTVAGVSNVGLITAGEWAGRICIGCSLVVGAGGNVLARGAYGQSAEELRIVEIA